MITYCEKTARVIPLPPSVDDGWLRERIATDFGRYGGVHALARVLGVSASTASVLRRGCGSLTKAAALYGYTPGAADGHWVRARVKVDPRHIGRMRWTPSVDAFIRESLHNRLGLERIAAHLGTTRTRVSDRIARKKLREGEPGSLQAAMEAAAARLVARVEVSDARRRLRRAEAKATKIFKQHQGI
ncbi:MAG: hypothetical protein ACOH2M_18595 [Cypionkella sp.]